jgi:hypothetical protein
MDMLINIMYMVGHLDLRKDHDLKLTHAVAFLDKLSIERHYSQSSNMKRIAMLIGIMVCKN